jgi:3-deoxy-manno-octulosonate cytidylyltransferase (CMP-KDO synthetase)
LIGFPYGPTTEYSLGPVDLILRGGAKECQTFHLTAEEKRTHSSIATDKQKINTDGMKIIAVIPARLASTRLPRKMLRLIAGQPLLGRVYEGVRSSPLLDEVIVATDSDEIIQVCRQHGWNARMTSAAHRSGTERVHEISDSVAADVYLNIQGDEPLTRGEHVAVLLDLMKDPNVQVGTLKTPASAEDIDNPNAVKVVTDAAGRALYFSRSTIPFDRDASGPSYFKHLGFYAYRKPALDRFCKLPESSLERCERLEQLRFLENGIPIHVAETPYDTVGVDTEEDLRKVEEILRRRDR